jgi:hypothetical protein
MLTLRCRTKAAAAACLSQNAFAIEDEAYKTASSRASKIHTLGNNSSYLTFTRKSTMQRAACRPFLLRPSAPHQQPLNMRAETLRPESPLAPTKTATTSPAA